MWYRNDRKTNFLTDLYFNQNMRLLMWIVSIAFSKNRLLASNAMLLAFLQIKANTVQIMKMDGPGQRESYILLLTKHEALLNQEDEMVFKNSNLEKSSLVESMSSVERDILYLYFCLNISADLISSVVCKPISYISKIIGNETLTTKEILKEVEQVVSSEIEGYYRLAECYDDFFESETLVSLDKKIYAILDEVPVEEGSITFSKRLPRFKPAVAAVLICIFLSGVVVVCHPTIAQAVKGFFARLIVAPQQDETVIVNLQENTEINQIFARLNRSAIPSEYVLVAEQTYEQSGYLEYRNDKGDDLTIKVYLSDVTVLLDNEDVSLFLETEFNGKSGVVTYKNGVSTVLWYEGQQYMVELATVLPVEQAIDIAKNLTKIN